MFSYEHRWQQLYLRFDEVIRSFEKMKFTPNPSFIFSKQKNQIFFAKSKVYTIKVEDEKIHQTTRHMRFIPLSHLYKLRNGRTLPNCADEMASLVI
jgi:hypothetical protein